VGDLPLTCSSPGHFALPSVHPLGDSPTCRFTSWTICSPSGQFAHLTVHPVMIGSLAYSPSTHFATLELSSVLCSSFCRWTNGNDYNVMSCLLSKALCSPKLIKHFSIDAKDSYKQFMVKQNRGDVTVTEYGLCLHPKQHFIGVCPDGLVCCGCHQHHINCSKILPIEVVEAGYIYSHNLCNILPNSMNTWLCL